MDTVLTILVSVITPIVVSLISSGVIGNKLTSKLSNSELVEKIDQLDFKVEKNNAEYNRARLLRFNGELKRGVSHDEEEFNDVLHCIDDYERFCKKYPDYPNKKSVLAIENIQRVYQHLIETNGF
jgi:hypothetical protein